MEWNKTQDSCFICLENSNCSSVRWRQSAKVQQNRQNFPLGESSLEPMFGWRHRPGQRSPKACSVIVTGVIEIGIGLLCREDQTQTFTVTRLSSVVTPTSDIM